MRRAEGGPARGGAIRQGTPTTREQGWTPGQSLDLLSAMGTGREPQAPRRHAPRVRPAAPPLRPVRGAHAPRLRQRGVQRLLSVVAVTPDIPDVVREPLNRSLRLRLPRLYGAACRRSSELSCDTDFRGGAGKSSWTAVTRLPAAGFRGPATYGASGICPFGGRCLPRNSSGAVTTKSRRWRSSDASLSTGLSHVRNTSLLARWWPWR